MFFFVLPDNKENVKQSINGLKSGVYDASRGHKIMNTFMHGWSSSEIPFSWIPENVFLWHLASPLWTIWVIKMGHQNERKIRDLSFVL